MFEQIFGDINTEKQVNNELEILKAIINLNDESLEFVKNSITNFSRIKDNKKLFEAIMKCFEIFEINGELSNLMSSYIKIIAVDDFDIEKLNELSIKVNILLKEIIQKESVILTITELSSAKELIRYLKQQNE